MPRKFLSIKEAAEILGVTSLTLRNWDKKGKLVASRNPINNYRMYGADDIESLLESIDKRKPRRLQIKLLEEESG